MTVWYMNGAGNDFAVVDARNINIDMSDMARALCERRGCDGFMALDNSSIADFKLHFYILPKYSKKRLCQTNIQQNLF